MTEFQKAIKYLAMAFAIFLTVCIIGGILSVVGLIAGFSSLDDQLLTESRIYELSDDITDIKMDIGAAKLTVKAGEDFSVESNLKNLTVEEKNGELVITEKKNVWKKYSSDATLVITVPEGFVFGTADITTGAGKVVFDSFSARRVSFEFGAGEVEIGELNVSSSAEIEGGTGKVDICGGVMNDLSLKMGVGEFDLTSKLSGDCELEYGVGAASLVLLGTTDDYRISIDKGIGRVTIDGESAENGTVYGKGDSEIDIESGIGDVTVIFKDQ